MRDVVFVICVCFHLEFRIRFCITWDVQSSITSDWNIGKLGSNWHVINARKTLQLLRHSCSNLFWGFPRISLENKNKHLDFYMVCPYQLYNYGYNSTYRGYKPRYPERRPFIGVITQAYNWWGRTLYQPFQTINKFVRSVPSAPHCSLTRPREGHHLSGISMVHLQWP